MKRGLSAVPPSSAPPSGSWSLSVAWGVAAVVLVACAQADGNRSEAYNDPDPTGQAGKAGTGGTGGSSAQAGKSGAAGTNADAGAGGAAGESGAAGEGGANGDAGEGGAAGSSAGAAGKGGKAGGTSTPPCENALLLNEILAVGPQNDEKFEFVELLNAGPEACAISLEGLTIERDGTEVFAADGASTLANGKRYVLAGQSFADSNGNSVDRGLGAQSVFPAAGACISLKKKGKTLDEVCYGTSGAPAPPASKSIGRVPDGADTDDDKVDWAVLDTPSPRGQN